MKKDSIDQARELGARAAQMKHEFLGYMICSKTILNNPYDRKYRKKEHVAWHNAFYKMRKYMGRRVI